MRGLALVVVLAGCGRLGFDGGAASDGRRDTAPNPDGTGLDDAGKSIYASAVLVDHPLSYWRLGDADAVARNEVSGAPTASFAGTLMRSMPGAVNDDTAAAFDGMTTRLDAGDVFPFLGTVPYSIEMWVNPTIVDDKSRWLIHRATSGLPENGWSIYHGSDFCLHARESDGTEVGYSGAGAPLVVGAWSHIVATFDGDRADFYVNGEERTNGFNSAPIVDGGAGLLTIGDRAEGQFFKFAGSLDEIALYDYVLTTDRITAHYAASGR